MRYFKITDIPPSWCSVPRGSVYSLQIRQEDRTKYWIVNYADSFRYDEFNIDELVTYYNSEQYKRDSFDSWYRAWCD